jgi:hypothetical protein
VQEQTDAHHCKQRRESKGDHDCRSRQGDAERGTSREGYRKSNADKQ